jgi:uncharacterized protein (DUF952 family)
MPSAPVPLDSVVYKICPRQSWLSARSSGALAPSRDDQRDGYIHLSAAHQVRGSLTRHFAGQAELVLLALNVHALPAGALVWETSRDGQLFPHLYGVLSPDLVAHVIEVAVDDEGQPQLPEGF